MHWNNSLICNVNNFVNGMHELFVSNSNILFGTFWFGVHIFIGTIQNERILALYDQWTSIEMITESGFKIAFLFIDVENWGIVKESKILIKL